MMSEIIIKLLESYGFKAWLCGGTARDIYMGNTPTNYDVAVNATLKELRGKLSSRITALNEYGTYIKVEFKNTFFYIYPLKKIELVNTYYNFSFTNSLAEDASTRDFTINALYYNPLTKEWFDYVDGRKDIDDKRIRLVGHPNTRILESKIRILRAATLSSILGEGWFVDQETVNAIKSEKLKLLTVNSRQINSELIEVFTRSKEPSKFIYELKHLDLLESFFPELQETLNIEQTNKADHLNLFQHILLSLDKVSNSFNNNKKLLLRITALLHDIGKPYTQTIINGELHFYQHEHVGAHIAEKVLYRWGFNKQFVTRVTNLIINHLFDANPQRSTQSIKKLIHRVGPENIHDLLELRYVDRLGNHRTDIDMKYFNRFKSKINRILEHESPKYFKLNIKDEDLKILITPLTNKVEETLVELKEHLKLLIRLKKVHNRKKKIIEYIQPLFNITCPLDLKHLINTWSDIYRGSEEIFQNGNLKCGLYCNFKCNKVLEEQSK